MIMMNNDKIMINIPQHQHQHQHFNQQQPIQQINHQNDNHDQNNNEKSIMKKFSHKNIDKPFKMSYRRLLSIVFIIITVINIISMIIYTTMYLNKMEKKEQLEKYGHLISQRTNPTNRNAYSIVRFINFTALIASVIIRIFGLIAIGVCGREFAYTEFETSDRRESFTGCLSYTCAMIILLAAYYVGIVRMVTHDLLMHCILTILGAIFITFSLQPTDTYSKELNASI